MKLALYDAVTEKVMVKLATITIANGFPFDLTVLNGWLKFYAADLLAGTGGKTFPVVCLNYSRDQHVKQRGTIKSKTNRTLILHGAVVTDLPEDVNRKLDELRLSVLAVLGDDDHLTLGDCDFMLPDNNEAYAMFTLPIDLTQVESWINE